jgi:flagellar biosynthesis component FlhA
VDGLLTGVAGSDEALAATVPPDVPSRLRFARLLRGLVREQVPITAWQEILHAVPDLCSKDLDGTLRACRLRLRKELPGNEPATRRYRVPQEWERFIVSEGGMTHFVGTPYDAYQLLLAIRSLVQDADRNAALLTPSAALRPYLRRLIECEFPYLMVLSEEELIAAAEAATKASAAHGGTV